MKNDYEEFKEKVLGQPISLLTQDNLHALELHCQKQLRREVGQRLREHEIVLELIHRYNNQKEEIEKQKKENIDLKDLFIRTAKHQEKLGHEELAMYMLAQIEAIPTFTTWEDYTTWISKDKIREIIKELDIDIERNKRRKINNNTEGNLSMILISYDPEIIKMRLLKLLEE